MEAKIIEREGTCERTKEKGTRRGRKRQYESKRGETEREESEQQWLERE